MIVAGSVLLRKYTKERAEEKKTIIVCEIRVSKQGTAFWRTQGAVKLTPAHGIWQVKMLLLHEAEEEKERERDPFYNLHYSLSLRPQASYFSSSQFPHP